MQYICRIDHLRFVGSAVHFYLLLNRLYGGCMHLRSQVKEINVNLYEFQSFVSLTNLIAPFQQLQESIRLYPSPTYIPKY